MNLRQVLLLSLAATPLSGCYLHCRRIPQEQFEIRAKVSVAELDQLVSDYELQTREQLSCERVCAYAYHRDRHWKVSYRAEPACVLELPSDGEGEATVACEGTGVEGYCKGRRPLGHIEAPTPAGPDALGNTLATMAGLEAASIVAFEQLAEQLVELDAPAPLIERCHAAADDERNHARWLTALAERHGPPVGQPRLEPHADDRVTIAVHNAVEGCVSEAFAALAAELMASTGESPMLRRIFARIAEDETRHGQLAWDLHAWFMRQLPPHERERVEAAQREALARLPKRVDWLAALPPELASMSPGLARQLAHNFVGAVALGLA